jgi:membrane-associated phospholipid phosphatase
MKKAALLFLLFLFKYHIVLAQGIDYQILKNLNKIQSPIDNKFHKFISHTAPPLSVGLPILLTGIGFLDKNENLTKKGIETTIAVGMTVAETYIIKKIAKRPRPFITYPDLKNLDTEGSYSFPSGHTSAAFSLATSLSLNYPKWYVIAPAYIWAGATGYSRMYLNVHYPSDVLMGAALGTATSWLTWKINKKIRTKKEKASQ